MAVDTKQEETKIVIVEDGPKPIEESLVDWIKSSHPSEIYCVIRIIRDTKITYNHDAIIQALRDRFDDKLIQRIIDSLEAQRKAYERTLNA